MKILLINPPHYRLLGSHYNGMNLGLSYIASTLKRNGFTVRIYNADFLPSNDYLTQEELFENSGKGCIDPDIIYDEIDNVLWAYNPDRVMISVMSATYESAKRIAEIVKRTGTRVIVGGPHITLEPDQSYKDFPTAITMSGDFLPDYEIIPDRASYLHDKKYMDYGNIISGTGCNQDCVFCAAKRLCKGKIKFRSVDIIEQEIREAKQYTNEFYFVDDTFTANKNRFSVLCYGISQLDIKYRCDTRLDKLDEDKLHELVVSGCTRIKVGVESGSDKILASISKGINVKQICEKIELIKQFDMKLTVYLMIGFPNETDNDVQATIDLAKWIEADYYSLSVVTPYPGTKLWDICKDTGHHQTKRLVMNDKISAKMFDKFLNINLDYGKGQR